VETPPHPDPLPARGRAVRGTIHYAAEHARPIRREPDTFWLSRLRKGPGMHYRNSILGDLLKPIDRRRFRSIVDRHDGDAYDKSFKSWDHMVALVGAQLGRIASLRGLELAFGANSHQHYHLGIGKVARSTLSDANRRRPVDVFADTFAMLAEQADRRTRVEGSEMVRLIDSSPVALGKMCKWAEWNGRIRGMKLHVVHQPQNDCPRCIEITPATVNDVEIGRQTPLDAGVTYVFDKGYCHFGWWKKINEAKAFLVTRVKANTRLRATKYRYVRKTRGDGFKIIDDAEVVLASKGDSRLAVPLRRIKVKRDEGGTITLITNDLNRTAVEIAALYKSRWQIELLFRWIKQHLNISKFMGKKDNAIRLQIIAAMIAYLLLRIARRLNSLRMLDLRFAELVWQRLFIRTPIARIDKPPPVNPSKPKPKFSNDQLAFAYV
jgi:putative transposase